MSIVDAIRALAENMDVGVVLTDGELTSPGPRLLYINTAFEKMTGYAAAEVLGKSPRMFQGVRTSLAARKALSRALRTGLSHRTTLINYRKNGEAYYCQIHVIPIHDQAGRLINAMAIEQEVRHRGRRRTQIES